MSRLPCNLELVAVRNFQKEIRMRQVECDLLANRQLSERTKIPATSLWRYMNDPMMMQMENMRSIVNVLHPDPAVVLHMLGYSAEDVRKFREEK